MDELEIEIIRMQDESPFKRDGSIERVKRVDFFIGKFGPFTERFPAAEFSADALNARTAKLRDELRALAR